MNQSELREKFEPLIRAYPRPQAALAALLHRLLDGGDVVTEDLIQPLAEMCQTSAESVKALIEYYKLEPESGHSRTKVCMGLTCYLNGAKSVLECLTSDPSIMDAEGATVMACVGHCYAAPVVALNGECFYRASIEELTEPIHYGPAPEQPLQSDYL